MFSIAKKDTNNSNCKLRIANDSQASINQLQ